MTAGSEDRQKEPPLRPRSLALSVLLALMALCFTANDLLAGKALSWPRTWQGRWARW